MWYMLWPNFVTKIGTAIAFFLSIMFATIGFSRLIQKSILEIKQKENKNYTNVILVFVGEILALVLTIIQFISPLVKPFSDIFQNFFAQKRGTLCPSFYLII